MPTVCTSDSRGKIVEGAGACDKVAAVVALCGLAFLPASEAFIVADLVRVQVHKGEAIPVDEWRRLARKVLAATSDLNAELGHLFRQQEAKSTFRTGVMTTPPDAGQLDPSRHFQLQEHIRQRAMLLPALAKKSVPVSITHPRVLRDDTLLLLCENVRIVRLGAQNGGGELQASTGSRLQRMRRKMSSLKITRDKQQPVQSNDTAARLASEREGQHDGSLLLTSAQIVVHTARFSYEFRLEDVKARGCSGSTTITLQSGFDRFEITTGSSATSTAWLAALACLQSQRLFQQQQQQQQHQQQLQQQQRLQLQREEQHHSDKSPRATECQALSSSRSRAHSAVSVRIRRSRAGSFAIPRLPPGTKVPPLFQTSRDRKARFFSKPREVSSTGVFATSFAAAAARWLKTVSFKRFVANKSYDTTALPPPQKQLEQTLTPLTKAASSLQPSATRQDGPRTQHPKRKKTGRKRSSHTSRASTAPESSVDSDDEDHAHRNATRSQWKKNWRVKTRWNTRAHACQDTRTAARTYSHALKVGTESRHCHHSRVHSLVFELLQSSESFEGHICARILRRQQFPSSTCPTTCRRYLNKLRDSIQDLVQFILTFRVAQLEAAGGIHLCEMFGSDAADQGTQTCSSGASRQSRPELVASVQAAVEAYFCGQGGKAGLLTSKIGKWCTAVATAPRLAAFERKRAQWRLLPTSSDEFALSNPDHVAHSASVERAIRCLDAMGAEAAPTRKLERFMESVQALNDHITLEHPPEAIALGSDASHARVCAADELLPLLIFALVRSRVREPQAHCVAMQQLCSFASEHGERVYYLTMLDTALEFVQAHQ